MSTHLCVFSDESMSRSLEACDQSARANGVRHVHRYAPAHVEDLLLRNGINPLARGCGYWTWKPTIILSTMDKIGVVRERFGFTQPDYLVYADAGVEFINNVSHIIDRMDQDIFLFGNNWEHAHWCKADVPSEILGRQRVGADGVQNWMWQDHPKHDVGCACRAETIIFGKQCQASVIFFRVSDYSRAFVAEWLKWCLHRVRFSEGVCTDEWRYLIDDSPSIAPNHPEFREHRHDQAILTTLAYREGIKLHYWPATYNDGAFSYEKLPEYANDDYPILFHHHRRRNHEWSNAA